MNIKLRGLVLLALVLTAAATAWPQGADLKTKEVIFGKFKTYVHPDKSFSMEIPENWSIDDSSKPNEAIVKSADPNTNAALVIHVWKQEGELPGGATEYLKDYLRGTVSTLPNYSQGEPKVQKDGSVGIYFKYDQTVKTGTFDMWGDAFIERKGNMVGMVFLIMPHEQYKLKMTPAYKLVNSFKLDAAVK